MRPRRSIQTKIRRMAFEKGNSVGRQFQPGQSGNPAGKPRGTQHSSTRLRRLLEAVQKAKNPVTKQEEEFTTLEMMDAAMISRAMKGDVSAYRELLDRLEGKVPQAVKHEGGLSITGNAAAVTDEQAAQLLAMLNQISPPA